MSWTPDKQLEHLVSEAIAARSDAMIRRQRDEKSNLSERMAGRGMHDSSVHFSSERQIDSETFDEAAQGIVGDVLGLFRNVYGGVPVEATAWIRQRLNDQLDGMAKGVVLDRLSGPHFQASR